MTTTLAELKKNRTKTLDSLREESEKSNKTAKKESNADPRFWRLTTDEAGNGYAVIRFLPAPKGEDLSFVKYWDHFFRGPTNKVYAEKSLTTIGQKDPVGEYNSELWNSGKESDKETARKQKRREHYISNVLIVNDPEKPENNGKVMLFRYGKKIFENKIKPIMFPDTELGEEPNNPFDFWTGQNFKLKCKKVSDFPNYDESSFANPSAIAKTDDEIEAIWKAEYPLKEFKDPANFKTYDELKAKMNEVLFGAIQNAPNPARAMAQVEQELEATVQPAVIASAAETDPDLAALLRDLDK